MKSSTRTKRHITWVMEKQEQCRNLAKTYPGSSKFYSELIDDLQKIIDLDKEWLEHCKEREKI